MDRGDLAQIRGIEGRDQAKRHALPDTFNVEYRWGLILILLAACKEEPRGPVQVIEPEAMRFETERIRREVDIYKTEQSPISKRRMEKAFSTFDEQLRQMTTEADALADPTEREAAQHRIANLKMRRDLHWNRSQTLYAEIMPVRKAEPIAERVGKSRPRSRARGLPIEPPPERVMKAEPVRVMRAEPVQENDR